MHDDGHYVDGGDEDCGDDIHDDDGLAGVYF